MSALILDLILTGVCAIVGDVEAVLARAAVEFVVVRCVAAVEHVVPTHAK